MKTIQTLFIAAAVAALGATSAPVLAQATVDHSKMAATAAGEMSDAEVRKVDKDQGKLTLKHGEIKNLDMPAMTMVFTVKDKAMLEGVKSGDKVRFKASNEGGKLLVIELVPAK
jgi:Cu(I)/Ag(I) efflux system periplasmic protein CusF